MAIFPLGRRFFSVGAGNKKRSRAVQHDMSRIAPIVVVLVLLAGCASYSGTGLKPGVATEGAVRAAMGHPAVEFTREDGGRTLAYPRGPLGTQTYMADLGRDGRLLAIRPVLGDETFWRIQPGMTREDILHLIGPPGETMAFGLSDTDSWDYRYMDNWGYLAIFSVTFNREGIVVGKFTRRIDRDKSR